MLIWIGNFISFSLKKSNLYCFFFIKIHYGYISMLEYLLDINSFIENFFLNVRLVCNSKLFLSVILGLKHDAL